MSLTSAFSSRPRANAVYETLTDASVRTHAMFVVLEGLLHVGGGLVIVWVGKLLTVKPPDPGNSTVEAPEAKPAPEVDERETSQK